MYILWIYRPTNKATVENKGQGNNNAGKSLEVGIADDQAKDFDFEKTEMKYDSTGMFHWTPARAIEDCILDRNQVPMLLECLNVIMFLRCSTKTLTIHQNIYYRNLFYYRRQ